MGFWIRESELAQGLDQHLLAALLEWLKAQWPFDRLVFTVSQGNERQAKLLQEAGLLMRHAFDTADGNKHWLVFC